MIVGVYGLGRFGAFWATVLSDFFEVYASSRSPRSFADIPYKIVSQDELFRTCDTIFLCVAISAVESAVVSLRDMIRPGSLVIDTCSVKEYPLGVLEKLLPQDIGILGTHPMFGPDSAVNGIDGLPIVITPSIRTSYDAIAFWSEAFRKMGLRVHRMSAEEHDREAAYSQGITHFIGRLLDRLDLKDTPIATLGYRKLLEIREQTCNDPFQLFVDLQKYNYHTSEMRQSLVKALNEVLDTINKSIDYDDKSSIR
ncbi:prephenate dehydrogenase/arogenate dehydrogenase family protein [Spirochaetia bacterium 38H-sp]|uniref:Prephenate dehydrogenase/arogenate dehydrogenase family protein n=1 Tax=Rarispira pelagica TaxID=3141764 RepID=A0ABU9UCW4_9SPIR